MHIDARGYAYETFRQGGQVRRRYVGSGELAGALVTLDRLNRQREADKRQEQAAQIELALCGSDELKTLCMASNLAFRAAMKMGGYHQPKRGAWRRARALNGGKAEAGSTMPKSTKTAVPALASTTAPDAAADSEYLTLLKRANNGDKDAACDVLAQVKGTAQEAPLLEVLASFSEVARERLIDGITDNELRKAGFRRQLERKRDELAGPGASSLEVHLAERVAICALAVARLESLWEQNASNTPKVWEAVGRQLDGANRRHLDAVKALVTVRKLRLPNVQVNIGEKQVNIGTMNGNAGSTD